jgi:Domain of unknown function (DUF4129)
VQGKEKIKGNSMDLSQLSAEIRPRKPWEAVDLGILMARHWWWPLTKAWLAVSLPILILLHILFINYLWAPLLILWWIKPLLERTQMFILSQALFGSTPTQKETLKGLRQYLKPQWLASITWRRFSLSRSMDLAVVQLEGLHGYLRSDRLRVLHREDASPASWLTIIGVHLESFFAIAAYGLIYALLPAELDIDYMKVITDEGSAIALLQNLIGYIVMTLVAPFYIASGFALYLNRRIKLEAWDIEIAFRRIQQRQEHTSHKKSRPKPHNSAMVTSLLTACLFLTQTLTPLPAIADNPTETSEPQATAELIELDRTSAKQSIEAVLDSETFNGKDTVRIPKLFDVEDKPEEDFEGWNLPDWLIDLFMWVPGALEVILWALAAALIVFIIFRYRHWILEVATNAPRNLPRRRKPATLFGLDVRRESLPDDVGAAAQALWQTGKQRQSLALLYRASLATLVEQGLDVHEGHTEGECVELVDSHSTAITADYFRELTTIWQRLAYGHQLPEEQPVLHLCARWADALTVNDSGTGTNTAETET